MSDHTDTTDRTHVPDPASQGALAGIERVRLPRRRFLQFLGTGAAATGLATAPGVPALADSHSGSRVDGKKAALTGGPPGPSGPDDERYWRHVARQFTISREFINLNAGHYGLMPDVVKESYKEQIERVNFTNTHYLGTVYGAEQLEVREQWAELTGVATSDLMITRGVTEALSGLIMGYNKLAPGDVAMYADIDYPIMQRMFEQLPSIRPGIQVVRIEIDDQPGVVLTRQAIVDAYAEALDQHPATKLLLLTDMVHRTGVVIPSAEIAGMARARGVDVINDAAHSWAHMDFDIPDLGADFVALNGHKWLNTPKGVGAIYIKQSRVGDIDPAPGAPNVADARRGVWMATHNTANVLAVPTAIWFHNTVGARNKQERLAYLADHWFSRVQELGLERIEVLTPSEPGMHGAIGAFRTTHIPTTQVPGWLWDRHRIFVVRSGGGPHRDSIRVTPSLSNTLADVDAFVAALVELNSIDGV